MQITPQALRSLSNGFNAAFKGSFAQVQSQKDLVAMTVPSTNAAENYGWMKDLPTMREWLGERVINNLESVHYLVTNRKFESTIGVKRDHIEDDSLGLYSTIFADIGEDAALHPDDLVWAKLQAGFDAAGGLAFDGQYFFDSDHIGYDENGKETSYSNVQAGAGAPWFLMDLSRNKRKPLGIQMRSAVEMTTLNKAEDENVFLRDEYLYGVRARYEAFFAWYQLAFGSKAELNATNYEAARNAMGTQKRAGSGRPLGISATHLIYGQSNEAKALELIMRERDASGASNIWYKSIEPVKVPWLP
jgi:phage major head subunit gpT-like protein